MSSQEFIDPNSILDRIKKAYGFTTDADLANFLSSNPSTVATWRKNKSMKFDRIIEFAGDLNFNWLIFGDLPIWRDQISKNGEVVMLREPGQEYGEKNMVERIKNLELPSGEKLELLHAYIELLEEMQAKERKETKS